MSDTFHVPDGLPAHLSIGKEQREYLLRYFDIREENWPRFTVDVLLTVDKEKHRAKNEAWAAYMKAPSPVPSGWKR